MEQDPDLYIHEQAQLLKHENGGTWGEHPNHPVEDWQHEAENDYTRLGYWEWVAARLDEE